MLLMRRYGFSTCLKVRPLLSTKPSPLVNRRRSKSSGPSSASFNASLPFHITSRHQRCPKAVLLPAFEKLRRRRTRTREAGGVVLTRGRGKIPPSILRDSRLTFAQEELYEYATKVRRTIREVVAEFRSVRVPRDYIFDVFPPLRPREFSIASSALAHPHEVHLCVAIIDYKTKLKARRRGVGTSFLASLPIGKSFCPVCRSSPPALLNA
jgi:hypothetical protein